MEIKTNKLEGIALDYAVAICEEKRIRMVLPLLNTLHVFGQDNYSPSRDWSQAGPIIEKEGIDLTLLQTGEWGASMRLVGAVAKIPLIAAMRCYVASKLGDVVDIPEELIS